MSYFTLSNGEQIYYEDTEKGDQTIIMMHGWSSSHEVYAPVVPAISKKARVITYDHRGHGSSKDACKDNVTLETLANDLSELIWGLGLHDITLLGWSMGAATAMKYIDMYGCGALRQVVLCDMTPKQMNDDEWNLGLFQGKYTQEDMDRDAWMEFCDLYTAFVIGAIPKLSRIPRFLLSRPIRKILDTCNEDVLKSLSYSMKTGDFRESIEKITVPVFYFYAVPGSLFSPELADWYREHVRTPYKAVAFPNCTHMMVDDKPHQFTREVLDVLSGR